MKKDADSPELIIDHNVTLPKPLDPRIASLILRTKTNDISSGYDLSLSASFGTERIKLQSDDFEVYVNFSLQKADIKLQFVRSHRDVLGAEENEHSDAWHATETEVISSDRSGGSGAELSASGSMNSGLPKKGSGNFSASWSKQQQAITKNTLERQRTQRAWYPMGPDGLAIGGMGSILAGQLVTDFAGWRVIPKQTDVPSGVVARINVREEWVSFSNLKHCQSSGRLGVKLQELIESDDSRRKRLFIVLLKRLAHLGLQSKMDADSGFDPEATIAMGALKVQPYSDELISLSPPERMRQIFIPSNPVEEYLFSPSGSETGTLVGLGVPVDKIPLASDEGGKGGKKSNFVPQSSPIKAVNAFCEIIDRPGQERNDLSSKVGRNELRDLLALGLVKSSKGKIYPANKNIVPPEVSLKRAVSLSPCIRIARAILLSETEVTPEIIAVAVAIELGKDWNNKATQKRHGGAIRRWTIWLEPHLIDISAGSEAIAQIENALSGRVGLRGSKMLTTQTEERFRELLARGWTQKQISDDLDVSITTLYNWKKELKLLP